MEHISRLLFVKPFLNREARFRGERRLNLLIIHAAGSSPEANRIPFRQVDLPQKARQEPHNTKEFATLRIP